MMLCAMVGVWHLATKNWILNNIFGLAFSVNAIEMVSLNRCVCVCACVCVYTCKFIHNTTYVCITYVRTYIDHSHFIRLSSHPKDMMWSLWSPCHFSGTLEVQN